LRKATAHALGDSPDERKKAEKKLIKMETRSMERKGKMGHYYMVP